MRDTGLSFLTEHLSLQQSGLHLLFIVKIISSPEVTLLLVQ